MTEAHTPRIALLLATHNGREFIEAQVTSILQQRDVEVRIFTSDDSSTDGTKEWIADFARQDDRVTVIGDGSGGSAPRNFMRLAMHADFSDVDAVGFVDQDDIWFPDKLIRQWRSLQNVDAVSSDVIAFFPDKASQVIRKSQTQRRFDYLCESGGPGCTFLLRKDTFEAVIAAVRDSPLLPEIPAHDWLIYAVTRAMGYSWFIDPEPTMAYRQHDHNVIGANVGVSHAKKRAKRLISGEFRSQCTIIARMASSAAPENEELAEIAHAFATRSRASSLLLVKKSNELRRRPRERRVLQLLISLGLF